MMRKNRALAVALALIMSLTYMPATAFAENTYEGETAGVQVDLSNEVTAAESKWGVWSAWQDEKVNASSTRQVETRQVPDGDLDETIR